MRSFQAPKHLGRSAKVLKVQKQVAMVFAALGVELPCKRISPGACPLWILYNGTVLGPYSGRTGRLLPPRTLARALRKLLVECQAQVRDRILALPPGHTIKAQAMAEDHRRWEKSVRAQYLTGHYLRKPTSDQFACWKLPTAVYDQLLRDPLDVPLVQLLLLLPLTTPCPLDKVTLYLHAPGRSATGQWLPWPQERVQLAVWSTSLVVVAW